VIIRKEDDSLSKQRLKGIFYVIMAAFCFATMNVFVKLSGDDIHFMTKTVFRTSIAALMAFILVMAENKRAKKSGNKENTVIDNTNKRLAIILLFVRSAFGTCGVICNFYAVTHLNVADASMLNKLSPFYVILLSAILLKEKPDLFQWIAVAIAFFGSMFIIKPSFEFSDTTFAALIGLLGGLGAGIAYTSVRKLGKLGVRSSVIILFFSLFSVIVVLPFAIHYYDGMSEKAFLLLVGSGIAAAGGQFFITNAYRQAPAKEISVYDYTQILFAALLGFFFLDQVPDIYSFIGYGIICTVGICVFFHNKKL